MNQELTVTIERIDDVVLLIGVMSPSTAEPGKVKVYYEKDLLALTSIDVKGGEYLSLSNVAKASGASLQRLATPRRHRLRFPKSSIIVDESSSDIRVDDRNVSLSKSPRRSGKAVLVPLELLPIALRERYGENRVHWDPRTRVARIVPTAYSLRLLRIRTYPDHTRVVVEGTPRHVAYAGIGATSRYLQRAIA